MNVLVVVAHPDDEVLGIGGTITRHTKQGDEVTVCILGEGITSRRNGQSSEGDHSTLEELRRDARRAAAILGVRHLRLFELPDNRFDTVDTLKVAKMVEQIAHSCDPEVVYTHFAGDLNIDHGITARAVLTALRPLPGTTCRRIYAFEVPSSTGWGVPWDPFVPNVFVDIKDTLDLKLEAMAAYKTEVRSWPHPRSLEALSYRARAWGSMVGLDAAEPLMLVREVIW